MSKLGFIFVSIIYLVVLLMMIIGWNDVSLTRAVLGVVLFTTAYLFICWKDLRTLVKNLWK